LDGRAYRLRHFRVDIEHSNISQAWAEIGRGAEWPDEEQ
jgi:hypothetical protein